MASANSPIIKKFLAETAEIESMLNAAENAKILDSAMNNEKIIRFYCDAVRTMASGISSHPSVPFYVFAKLHKKSTNPRANAILIENALQNIVQLMKQHSSKPSKQQLKLVTDELERQIQTPSYELSFARLRQAWEEMGFKKIAQFADMVAMDSVLFHKFRQQFPGIKDELVETCAYFDTLFGDAKRAVFVMPNGEIRRY